MEDIDRNDKRFKYARARVIRCEMVTSKWYNWLFTIKFMKKDCARLQIKDSKVVRTYTISHKHFKREEIPRIGDKVIVRCRLTKENPQFDVNRSFIVAVEKDDKDIKRTWKCVKNELPNIGESVLILDNEQAFHLAYYDDRYKGFVNCDSAGGYGLEDVESWCEIPEYDLDE